MLNFEDVVGSLLVEEIGKKSMDHGKQDATLNVERGRNKLRGSLRIEVSLEDART